MSGGAALILLLALNFHRKLVYRLAAYQVLTSLVFAVSNTLNLAAVDYHGKYYTLAGESATLKVCQFVAFMRMCSAWMKLLAVVLVTVHLYCYVVRYNNWKRCEGVYVIVTVLVPTAISVIPFATGSYGPDGQWCWIARTYKHAEVEKLTLWFGPAVFFLSVVTSMVVYMAVVQYRRAYLEETDDVYVTVRQAHKQVFKQMLPLLAYPVLFFIFLLPSLVSQMYSQEESWQDLVNAFFSAALSISAGVTLILHISIVWCRMY